MEKIILVIFIVIIIGNNVIDGQYLDSNSYDICETNEEYLSCGSSCPPTCDDILDKNQRPRMCTMECRQGCFCKKELVRNTKDNQCIRPEQCGNGSSSAYVNINLIWLSIIIAIFTIQIGNVNSILIFQSKLINVNFTK